MKVKVDIISIVGLFLIFLIMKLINIINWAWIWIFSPLWIAALIVVSIILGALLITIIKVIAQNYKFKKEQEKEAEKRQ